MAEDIERTVELMVCAFILLGILVVGGWAILIKSGAIFSIGMTEQQLKEKIPEGEYADTMGYLQQQSLGFWLIAIVTALCGLAGVYIVINEVLSWSTN